MTDKIDKIDRNLEDSLRSWDQSILIPPPKKEIWRDEIHKKKKIVLIEYVLYTFLMILILSLISYVTLSNFANFIYVQAITIVVAVVYILIKKGRNRNEYSY